LIKKSWCIYSYSLFVFVFFIWLWIFYTITFLELFLVEYCGLDCLIVGYHCYLSHNLCCGFQQMFKFTTSDAYYGGNKTNYSSERYGY